MKDYERISGISDEVESVLACCAQASGVICAYTRPNGSEGGLSSRF